MANQLSLKKMDLSDDWNDDIRMNFLFAVFREKTVNPEGYEAKMKFWTNFILSFCLKCETPVISLDSLRSALERKGSFPECLDVVLENMYNEGLIMSLSDFSKIQPEKGWIGWGFDVLVQKPISWGFSTVQGLMNWAKKGEQFVVLLVVKDLAEKLLHRHNDLVNSELIDNIIFLDAFEAQCKDVCSGMNFNLAIVQLQKDKHAYVFEDKGRKVIKFRKKDDDKVKPLTELDRGILNLQSAKDKVMDDIDSLENGIQSSTDEIKELLRSGYKTKAMFALKKKKRLEAILKKKSVALDNIESLLCQLQNSDSEKMVLNAYKLGAQAIKAAVKDDLNLDAIDTTMAEVEGVLDDYEEVKRTLSKPVSGDFESLDDFEAELNELLENEKSEKGEKEPSPTKVTDDDLFRRLAALRAPPEVSPEGVSSIKKTAKTRYAANSVGVPPIKKPAMNRITANFD